MNTTKLKTRNRKYVHEHLAEIIKKAGYHIEVNHHRYSYSMNLSSGSKRNVVGQTFIEIYDKNPCKNEDALVVAFGDSKCVAGDNFCKRLGVTLAMRRAYANLRSKNIITRKQVVSLTKHETT